MSMADAADDTKAIDASGFETLERATGVDGFTLDEESRHRLEWALFWARTSQKKAKIDITNLIIELAVQYAHAANISVVGAENGPAANSVKTAKGGGVTKSFFAFVKNAVAFVPEARKLSEVALEQHIRRALASARRQKDDPKSRLPPDRREELHVALGK